MFFLFLWYSLPLSFRPLPFHHCWSSREMQAHEDRRPHRWNLIWILESNMWFEEVNEIGSIFVGFDSKLHARGFNWFRFRGTYSKVLKVHLCGRKWWARWRTSLESSRMCMLVGRWGWLLFSVSSAWTGGCGAVVGSFGCYMVVQWFILLLISMSFKPRLLVFGIIGDFLEGGAGVVMVVGCCMWYLKGWGCLLLWTWCTSSLLWLVYGDAWLGKAIWSHELGVEVMNLTYIHFEENIWYCYDLNVI